MTPIAPLITAFLREYMPTERGYSPHTCETYAHAFRLLFVFASERLGRAPSQLCLEHLDASLVLDFLAHIEQQRGNEATTRNSRLAAIKAFMRYVEFRVPAALEQVMQIRAIPTKRHDHALVRHLTMGEVRAILDAPDLTTRLGIRDRAMLHLCFAGGLRVSELVGLPLAHASLHPTRMLGVAPSAPAQLCRPDAPGHPRHSQSGPVARPCRCADDRDLLAAGSLGKAGGRGGCLAARFASRAVQGTRCADRLPSRTPQVSSRHRVLVAASPAHGSVTEAWDYAEHNAPGIQPTPAFQGSHFA